MTIEDFELEVRNIFISKGWATENPSWFTVMVSADYKNKCVGVIHYSDMDDVITTAETYEEAFSDLLETLRSF